MSRPFGHYTTRHVLRRLSRRTLGPALVRLTADPHYDLSDTLVVAGSPRSGTTWLAEVLSTIPGAAILFEPEHVRHVPEAHDAGLDWHDLREPGDPWPAGERYYRRVLEGKVINAWTVSHVPLRRALAPKRWIVKFVDANLLLGWLSCRFPIRLPVLLLRHPCAVVGSQLRRGWRLDHPPRLRQFFERYPAFEPYVASLANPVEWSAALWCIQTYVPLRLARPWPFVLMTYEEATANPAGEFGRLFQAWHLPMPSDLVARAARPSETTDRGSAFRAGADPRTAWQSLLTPSEVDKVMRVVRTFGLDFYSECAMPDMARIAESPARTGSGSQALPG